MKKSLFPLVLSMALLSGCASLIHGQPDTESAPASQQVAASQSQERSAESHTALSQAESQAQAQAQYQTQPKQSQEQSQEQSRLQYNTQTQSNAQHLKPPMQPGLQSQSETSSQMPSTSKSPAQPAKQSQPQAQPKSPQPQSQTQPPAQSQPQPKPQSSATGGGQASKQVVRLPNEQINFAKVLIEADLSDQMVYVKQDGRIVRAMPTSSGLDTIPDNSTPRGEFTIEPERGEWFFAAHYKEGAKYWVSFKNHGEFLFHSIVMDANQQVIAAEAQKLGTKASHGCFRLAVEDAKWIYDNIRTGTKVIIHD